MPVYERKDLLDEEELEKEAARLKADLRYHLDHSDRWEFAGYSKTGKRRYRRTKRSFWERMFN